MENGGNKLCRKFSDTNAREINEMHGKMQLFMILGLLLFTAPATTQSTTGDDQFGFLATLIGLIEQMLETLVAPLQVAMTILSQPGGATDDGTAAAAANAAKVAAISAAAAMNDVKAKAATARIAIGNFSGHNDATGSLQFAVIAIERANEAVAAATAASDAKGIDIAKATAAKAATDATALAAVDVIKVAAYTAEGARENHGKTEAVAILTSATIAKAKADEAVTAATDAKAKAEAAAASNTGR